MNTTLGNATEDANGIEPRVLTRCVTIPVAGPVNTEWPVLRELLRSCWRQSTQLSNWSMARLFSLDPHRMQSEKKLEPYPKLVESRGEQKAVETALGREARELWPDMSTRALYAIIHATVSKYRKVRFDIVTGRKSLPSFRYPQPYPLKAGEGYRNIRKDAGGAYLIDVQLGKHWVTLRLRGGHDFKRQTDAIQEIVDGNYKAREFALYEMQGNFGDHRAGTENRDPGGGNRSKSRLLLKMVVAMPRPESRGRSGTLLLANSSVGFLAARIRGRNQNEAWAYHDEVKKLIASLDRTVERQRERMGRLRRDNKHERRHGVGGIHAVMSRVSDKYSSRMDSFRKQVASEVAGFADRRGMSSVIYDETDRGFVSRFNYSLFVQALRNALDVRGIEFSTLREVQSTKKAAKTAAEVTDLEREIREVVQAEMPHGKGQDDDNAD